MSDKYLMDSHKLLWHPDRIAEWMKGERIAPLHIDAGLSKGCNIRCSYCFGAMQGNTFAEGVATFFPREPLLRYMKDAGAVGVRSIALIGEAEPLMNPHVYEAIVCGSESGVDMALGTNGTLFDTGRDGEAALEHLCWLRFNISAASDAAYRKVHNSELFPILVDKIRHVVAVKRRKGLKVTIGMQMVLTPGNLDQAIPLARLGRELGVDYLVIKQCSDTVDSALGVYERLGEYAGFADILAEAEAVGNVDYRVIVKWNKVTNKGERSYGRCLGAPFLLYSSGDGRLYPCGIFFNNREEEFRLGDLTKNSLKEILESDRYTEVMRRVGDIEVKRDCYSNCRTDAINGFLWELAHPPQHLNFI